MIMMTMQFKLHIWKVSFHQPTPTVSMWQHMNIWNFCKWPALTCCKWVKWPEMKFVLSCLCFHRYLSKSARSCCKIATFYARLAESNSKLFLFDINYGGYIFFDDVPLMWWVAMTFCNCFFVFRFTCLTYPNSQPM